MSRLLVPGLLIAALSLGAGALGCAPQEDGVEQNSNALSSEDKVEIVRAYYNATKTADPAKALDPIIADDAVLAAPSVQMLQRVPELRGKKAFIDGVAGGSFLLKKAFIQELIADDRLVISRIQLPLPNGDLLTQVEFFEIRNGKIARLDSYYDSIRFAKALVSIGIAGVKDKLESMTKGK